MAKKFGKWLAEQRERLAISPERLGAEADVSGSTIRNAEAGARLMPRTEKAIVFALRAVEEAQKAEDFSVKRR